MSDLRYVYGIVPAAAASAIDTAAVRGLDDRPVRCLLEGTLAAAYSQVGGGEYGEAGLNERVRDLEWLTPRAGLHQSVNARLLEIAGVVLPLSFGALYRDDARVKEMLRKDAADRRARLEALAGKAEWVVTVLREAGSAPASVADLRALDDQIAVSTPGKGYLLEKRRTTVASEVASRADADAAGRALALLERASERSYVEPVAKGGGDIVVLRVSLLASRARTGAVDGAIASVTQELDPLGYRVRATGPWPAYRFGAL